MTIIDVRNQLIGHFCKKDTFSGSDFSKIQVDNEVQGQRDGIIVAALDELEDSGMIRQVEPNLLWMLAAPLGNDGQQVDVPLVIAYEIAKCINQYAQGNDLPIDTVDALNLHAGHIATLVSIINDLADQAP